MKKYPPIAVTDTNEMITIIAIVVSPLMCRKLFETSDPDVSRSMKLVRL